MICCVDGCGGQAAYTFALDGALDNVIALLCLRCAEVQLDEGVDEKLMWSVPRRGDEPGGDGGGGGGHPPASVV
jgi:hypothetical protein